MFQETEIKIEKISNAICFCCLSIDRALRPLENYRNILCRIMGDDKNCMQCTEETLICWECMAFLKRTLEFHQKVIKASFMLSTMDLSHFENNSLSRLNQIWITNTDFSTDTKIILKEEEVIKAEITNDIINNEDGLSNHNDTTSDIPIEMDDDFINDDYSDEKSKINIKTKKKTQSHRRKIFTKDTYKKINMEKITYKHQYELVRVDPAELSQVMNEERITETFQSAIYKCDLCVNMFKTSLDKEKHFKLHHSKKNKFVCDICAQTFPTKQSLIIHCRTHDYKYRCLICSDGRTYYCRKKIYKHFVYYHRVMYVCKMCHCLPFGCRAEFVTHYKESHMKFTCDHCEKTYTSKEVLIKHISKHHSKHICTICQKSYKQHKHYTSHMRTFHPVTDQNAYCVECNMVFKSDLLYKRHLRTSVKHIVVKKKSYPCPKCNKVYLKHCTMNYHYNFVHENQSKFKCDRCQRTFLNGYILRQHIANVHDMIPKKKNKICSYCGRGFNTNKILSNHILTHTGERPHKCDKCGTTFAQKTALMYHIKNVHGKHTALS